MGYSDQGLEAQGTLAQKLEIPTIEDPVYGTEQDVEGPPGFWANRAKQCIWPRTRKAAANRTSLLYSLRGMELTRESILRQPMKRGKMKCVHGSHFDQQVGKRIANGEALLAHAVGEKMKPGEECVNCTQGDGKFVSCVRVPGQQHCTCCHWREQNHRCSLNDASEQDNMQELRGNDTPESNTPGNDASEVNTAEQDNLLDLRVNDASEANTPGNNDLKALQDIMRAMKRDRKAFKKERKASQKERKALRATLKKACTERSSRPVF
ncbi:hypothetical protein N7449_011245 [Penicillium cf. viridicatum]|uniref:Uncharacterized protein n=1 Tax=Penicillium cf. viridicatum TaxID=2972119 RepID=A0A9W9J2S4_9EURO|nr:hypothetical protein N7449_011245 [Penicillium cf. viridicatum]